MVKKWQIVLFVCALVGTILTVSGCSKGEPAKTGDTVKVDYTLTLADGTVYDTSEGKEPLEFKLGENQVIVGFEKAVIGMTVGQTKTVTIPVDEAYGPRRDDMIIKIKRSDLPQNRVPKVGEQLQADSPNGTYMLYPIIAVDDTTVTVDANHPLADKELTFKVKLVEIVGK